MKNDQAELHSTLVGNYQRAVLEFNAASTALIVHLSLPGNDLIAAEENARAAVIAARQKLWNLYRKVQRAASQ